MDEPVKERTGRNRIFRGEVKHRTMVLPTRDLDIHGEDEGLLGPIQRLSFAKRVSHAVIGASEYVVEFGSRTEPVEAGRLEEPVTGGRFLLSGKIIFGSQREEVSGGRSPAVGAMMEVHMSERSAVDGFLSPIGGLFGDGARA